MRTLYGYKKKIFSGNPNVSFSFFFHIPGAILPFFSLGCFPQRKNRHIQLLHSNQIECLMVLLKFQSLPSSKTKTKIFFKSNMLTRMHIQQIAYGIRGKNNPSVRVEEDQSDPLFVVPASIPSASITIMLERKKKRGK